MAGGMAYGNQLMVQDASLKRRSSHLSNSNATFKSGHTPMDDIYLYKTGIRGRKKYTLYLIIIILFLIALANILTTFILLGVLHLGYGMESMEFIPPGLLIRFLRSANIDVVIPMNGIVGGFKGEDLHIFGNDQPVFLQTKTRQPSVLEVNPKETSISNINSFQIVNPKTGRQIFSTEYASFGLPKAVRKLNVHQVVVNKISSPVSHPLSLRSNIQIRMRGNEGMHMSGLEVILSAGQDVYLKSRNASIVLDARNGVILSFDKFPKLKDTGDDEPWQYKICVCKPSGKWFRIPIRQDYNCTNAVTSGLINPCI